MKKTVHKRTITAADLAAAARLRAIWDATPRKERPTQEAMADKIKPGAQQGLTSQYLNGRIALNYKAVLAFAAALKCAAEQIRDDLPEQVRARELGMSQSVRSEAQILAAHRDALGITDKDVWARLQSMQWPTGITPPNLATVAGYFDGTRRPLDMVYRGMLYKALELSAPDHKMEGVAKTELGARLLDLAESGDPDEMAALVLMLEARNKNTVR